MRKENEKKGNRKKEDKEIFFFNVFSWSENEKKMKLIVVLNYKKRK